MRAFGYVFAAVAIAAPILAAQTPAQPNQAAQAHPEASNGTTTLYTGTQLVVVDVVVQDVHGKPVHALKREDFNLTEDKQPQTLTHFEEHTNLKPTVTGPALPPMPPGTFTDYTPVPASGALNILLLDTLNTPMNDQSYVRYQLQQYVKKAQPGTRIAIFGLAQHLYILQGFTSDPDVLKGAVEHKLVPRASDLLDDPAGSGSTESMTDTMADMGIAASPNLIQFEAEMTSFQTEMRIQYTLDAFNALAHYLVNFPGRKNLIWFSGAFPIDILPDASLEDSFSVMQENDPEFRETTNLLAQAEVAVYPVDAAGLATDPTFSASAKGSKFARNSAAISQSVMAFGQSQADIHMTMDQLADDTGGSAFYNNNDLAEAVSRAIEAGSNYYTLEYTPKEKKTNDDYHNIKVTLSSDLASAGYKLSYRHGYYSDEPSKPSAKAPSPQATTTAAAQAETTSGATYVHTALSRGAPAPDDILFKVRVLPASTQTEDKVADGDQTDPIHPIKPPFRRYLIDFASLADGLKITHNAEGRYTGGVEFIALLYDPDGKLLNVVSKDIQFNMTPETYARLRQGLSLRLELSAPVKGESYLRLGVRDLASNHIGAVEVPISAVSKLAPPPPPAATPVSPSTPPPAPPNAPAAAPPATSTH